MLEAIRTHSQTWLAKVILALITIPFALWGIDSYFSGGGQDSAVANIGDAKVTEREYTRALTNQRDGMQAQGGKVDINDPAFRKRVLDQLVDALLISSVATSQGMVVPQSQITAMTNTIPAFQENGQFSRSRMEMWLRNRGMTEQDMLDMIQQDVLMRQLQFAYGEGSLISAASTGQLAKHLAQQREASEVIFGTQAYTPAVKIDDKAVEADYAANKANHATSPQARIQYLVLSMSNVAASLNVGEEAVKQYYEANKTRYQDPEKRRASHILIKTDPGMSPAVKAEAKAKADKLLRELRQSPAGFANMAKQNSQDPGSAARGGDLGAFTRDMMVKPFSDAAFSMKPGEIGGPVESEFGYHIIRLDGVTPAATLEFAAVRERIVQELKTQEAQRKFAEMADRFSNLVYEKPDSLEPAAKELGLAVAESGWISRGKAEPAMLANPRLLDAVFAPEAVDKKQNTEAIEIGPSVLVAARVLEYKPAGMRPLAEAAAEIRQRLTAAAASAKAIEAGKAALAAAQAGQPPSGFGMPMMISRMQQGSAPPSAVKAIFKASASKLPAYVGVELPDGYHLYRISQVKEGEVKEGVDKMIGRDLSRLVAQEELRAYLEYARARSKVQINQALLEKKAE